MIKWFRKYFIPHEENDHRPHFLRTKNIRLLILAVFVVELGFLALPYIPILNPANNGFMASVLPAVLDDLSNQNRQSQHLSVLTISPILNKVAELKAQDMATKGYFAHISPEGKAPWYWFNLVGYKYDYAGENLAINFTDSQDVDSAWMNSPTHRANIIKNAYTEMGTGIATGTYNGYPTVFVAQVYGRPTNPASVSISNKVAVNTMATSTAQTATTSVSRVLGASTEAIALATPPQTYTPTTAFEQLVASPRHVANTLFILLGMLIISALIFKLFIRMDKKHPILITNGLIVLVLLLGVYTINNYIAMSKLANTTSFASFSSEQFDSAN